MASAPPPGVIIAARATVAGLVALTLLELLWELLLAPLPTTSRWLAFKALPLAFLITPVARGHRKARQWLLLLTPLYFAEGVVRAGSEGGRHSLVAATAAVIAALTFTAGFLWFRRERAAALPGKF